MVGRETYIDDPADGHTPGYLTPAYLPANRCRDDVAAIFICIVARCVSVTNPLFELSGLHKTTGLRDRLLGLTMLRSEHHRWFPMSRN